MPQFIMVPRGEDPNAKKNATVSYVPCKSVRRSRAIREQRKHYGTKLYEWSSERGGWIPARVIEPDTRFRSASVEAGMTPAKSQHHRATGPRAAQDSRSSGARGFWQHTS